jgi:hypothetical protein
MIRRTALSALLAVALLAPAASAKDVLTLRVNDAIGEPGGRVAVVIRTYAPRPVGQGQICFTARSRGGGSAAGPFAELEEWKVFSRRGDELAIASIEPSADGQTIVVEFSSDSATINRKDGPLAVLFFRLRDDVRPRQRFNIAIDIGNTVLFDQRGDLIRLEPRAGELQVRRPAEAFKAQAEDDKIVPGEVAELGMETYEPVAMAAGRIGLRFDPEAVAGRIKVKMRKQHGKRKFKADRSEPGLVLVDFTSRSGTLNTVPGEILSVEFRTPGSARVGSRSRVWIDPSLTFFEDPEGDLLPFRFEAGQLEFEAD